MHDQTLERTTSGAGAIAETPYRDLPKLDAGSWFAPQFAREPVPSFESAGKLCREFGLWANFEIKLSTGFEAETGKAAAKEAVPELPRGALDWPGSPQDEVGRGCARAPARGPPLWEMPDAGQGEFDPQVQQAPDYEFDQRIA